MSEQGNTIFLTQQNHLNVSKNSVLTFYNRTDRHVILRVCTQEEIRTPTPIQAPAPQAGASTNFATWVSVCKYINLV